MSLAEHQKVAGLRDVLGCRTPMHPSAMGLADDPAEFPDQGDDGVAGARQPLVDSRPVEQLQARRARDRLGRRLRDDAEFALRLGERGLDIEPSLPPVFPAVEGADARIRHARSGREFIAHDGSSASIGPLDRVSLAPSAGYAARGRVASAHVDGTWPGPRNRGLRTRSLLTAT